MKKSISLALLSLSFLLAACKTSGDTATTRPPKGNLNAAVVVIEYADLQCPACAAAYVSVVKPLFEKYGDKVRFELKHFPLRSLHRYALEAAEASECAADEGKFWEFVDLNYTNQKDLDSDQLRAWGTQLGLDETKFDACISSNRKRAIVLADYEEGKTKGVGGTPTFFVNGQPVETGVDEISAAIEAELGRLMQKL